MRPVLAGVKARVEVTLRVQGGIKGLYQNRGHLHLPDYPDQGQGPTDCRQFLYSGFIAVAGMFAEWLASVEFPVDL
ncbi:hypothetical protein GOBAR_DD21935 [Gossypium barbadense]|nr:hypothetical protein GOBAR_DD21935 [Gossypium barbadense]